MNDARPVAPPRPTLKPHARARHWARRHFGLLLFVAAPTLLAAFYYFFLAADMYASEARYVVRSPSQIPFSGVAGFLQASGGLGASQSEVYAVKDFILSRDAIAALESRMDLREIFARPEADFLARFPNLRYFDTSEDFYQYYQTRVQVAYDTTTGLSTLTVKAFRPEDAKRLATNLLDASEDLINRLNDRSRKNAVRDAEAEVKLAEENVAAAQQGMLDFRTREVLLDPGKASGAMFQNLAKMQAELSEARMRLAELERNSPGSPLRADIEAHVRALEQQIHKEREEMAGGDASMAPKISEYDQLLLRQEFAARELTTALASLEAARAEARRQQVYLERVVEPGLPDTALYPKRVASVLIVFISCFLIYSIATLLLAGVREHAQD